MGKREYWERLRTPLFEVQAKGVLKVIVQTCMHHKNLWQEPGYFQAAINLLASQIDSTTA